MLNGADYLIFAIIGVSALIGLWRGFIKEAFSLVVWAAAFGLSIYFGELLAAELVFLESVENPETKKGIARAIVFITTLVLGGLVGVLVQGLIKVTGLTGTDKLVGLIFGLGRGAFVIFALLLILPVVTPVDERVWWQESTTIPLFLEFEDWAKEVVGNPLSWLNRATNTGT